MLNIWDIRKLGRLDVILNNTNTMMIRWHTSNITGCDDFRTIFYGDPIGEFYLLDVICFNLFYILICECWLNGNNENYNVNFLLVASLSEKGKTWYRKIVKYIGMTYAYIMVSPSTSSIDMGGSPLVDDFLPHVR